ncbi:tripartite tricarboxylate transporter TctB family protein [Acetomicrobium sp. S15 = DSM 107314]|uniref:tripartite tricarboxylate transporter TctB family protein n=1 Tax=Acetomicrobium sp. S15 = DSM 107314 TaxID=2529858 RepID=UPI0018E14B9D
MKRLFALAIDAALISFGAAYFAASLRIPRRLIVGDPGSAAVPACLGLFLLSIGVILAARDWNSAGEGFKGFTLQAFAMAAITTLYIIFLPKSYTMLTALYIFCCAIFLSKESGKLPLWLVAAFSVALSLASYGAFRGLLGVDLPDPLIELIF